MQTEKEYLEDRCLARVHSESAGDYSLPDYNGDVKKILLISPRVTPSGKFLGDDGVEFSGVINYDVIYLDSENKVTHTDFSTDYDVSVRVSSDKYVDSDINTSISNYNVRLVGPRKFSAKCQLESEVHIGERSRLTILGDALENYEPEVSTVTLSVATPVFAEGESKEYTEELLNLEGAIVDEVEVLLCNLSPHVRGTVINDSGVEIKGDLDVEFIYKNLDTVEEKIHKCIPFAEHVTIDIDTPDSLCADVCVMLSKCNISPTEDGVSVTLSATLCPKVRVVKNENLELVTDAYLKERGTSNEYTDFNYTEYVCTESYESNFTSRVPISELAAEGVRDFLHVMTLAHVEGCELVENGVKINGEIKFSGVACEINEDGLPLYSNVKTTVPFEEIVNVSCQMHDNMRAHCHVLTENATMEVDGEHLVLSCVLSSRVTLNSHKKQRCLGSCSLTDDEYAKVGSVITVYYPDSGESIFSVAKRFHTSVRNIAEDNSLSESVFAAPHAPLLAMGQKKLIIK